MLKILATPLMFVFVATCAWAAGTEPKQAPETAKAELPSLPLAEKKTSSPEDEAPSRKTIFIVETDEDSANEALDRVSGDIDMGFALPYQTYKSQNHSGAGPFSEQAESLKSSGE